MADWLAETKVGQKVVPLAGRWAVQTAETKAEQMAEQKAVQMAVQMVEM
jgi:hypothetical protein